MKLPEGVRPASLDGLLAVRGVVDLEEEADDADMAAALAGDLRSAIGDDRLAAGGAARRGTGAGHLLEGSSVTMERLVGEAEACPARQPAAVRARLEAQIATLLYSAPSLDPTRLHQEAVLIAARADIREELDRLNAHVAAAREVLRTQRRRWPPSRLSGPGVRARGEHAVREGGRRRLVTDRA